MAQTYCINCGAGLDDAKFCATCGTPAGAAAANPASPTDTAFGAASSSNETASRVGFVEAVRLFFNNYANFEGRSSQSAYWFAFLFAVIVNVVTRTIDNSVDAFIHQNFTLLETLTGLAMLVPGLAVAVRRLHDTGRSGHNLWFILIPIVGAILLLIWLAQPSEAADNRFGSRP